MNISFKNVFYVTGSLLLVLVPLSVGIAYKSFSIGSYALIFLPIACLLIAASLTDHEPFKKHKATIEQAIPYSFLVLLFLLTMNDI